VQRISFDIVPWPVCPVSETAAPHRMGAALTYARRYALFAPARLTSTRASGGGDRCTGGANQLDRLHVDESARPHQLQPPVCPMQKFYLADVEIDRSPASMPKASHVGSLRQETESDHERLSTR
jgi:hypothetical protein